MPRLLRSSLSFIALALVFTSQAHAGIGRSYGFGSRTSALAGAGAAWGFEGYSAYSNPAALSLQVTDTAAPDRRLTFSWSLIDMTPNFTPVNGVVVENEVTGDQVRTGNVDMSYRESLGQELGFGYHLFPDAWNFSFGLTAYLPIDTLGVPDTGETYAPEYFLYRGDTQRLQLNTAISVSPSEALHFGGGVHIGFALTTQATIFLQTKANSVSSMRFGAAIKPKASPYLGALYAPPGAAPAFTVGAVLRFPVASDFELTVRDSSRIFSSLAALDFNFKAFSTPYYDPLSFELGTTIAHNEIGRLYLQADYQFWSSYKAPALSIQDPSKTCTDPSCTSLNFQPSNLPSVNYRNILIPRVGEELKLGSTVLRAGYSYRPSILTDLPSGPGNYVDPSVHRINAGVGFRFDHFLGYASPCALDLNVAYDQLVSEHVTKTAGDENGSTAGGAQKIGSPGYDTGGKIFGGGATLTLAF